MKRDNLSSLLGKMFFPGLFILLLLSPQLIAADQTPSDTVKFRIGAILPLTGENATLGIYLKKGIELAYTELSAEEKKQIELYFEDDAWRISRSISAFHRLVTIRNVNAVIVAGSAVGNALAPLADQRKILLIAAGASDHKLAKGRKYSFIHWVTPEVEARVAAEEFRRQGYQKIAFITVEQEGWLAVYYAVVAALKDLKLDQFIVLDEKYLPEERDFRAYIAKARSKKVDAVVVGLFPGAIAAFAKQFRQAGLEADMVGLETFENEDEVRASEGTLLGQWYVNADAYSDEFVSLYKEKYKEYPGWCSANAFDSFNLLVQGFHEQGLVPEKIAEYLGSVKNYSGATGIYSATGDNRYTLPAAIKIITKDGFEKVER